MRFICDQCGNPVGVGDEHKGTKVACGRCGEKIDVPMTRLSPSSILNDFIVSNPVAEDPGGNVYLAHQMSLNQPVWLKILPDELAGTSEAIVDFVKEIRKRAADYSFQPRPRSVGEDEGIYFQAYECADDKDTKAVEAILGK